MITCVLGPTNTGKTFLAVKQCFFQSGMIGFPLRLCAREVYDKVIRKNAFFGSFNHWRKC